MSPKAASDTASTIETYLKKVDKVIEGHEKLDKILTDLEDRIKVKKSYVFLIGITLVIVGLGSGLAGQLLCNAIGFLYPSYASIKAIGKTIRYDFLLEMHFLAPRPNLDIAVQYFAKLLF